MERPPRAGEITGSPVTADLTGAGYQDILVPTTNGVDIFDGQTGAEVGTPLGQARISKIRRLVTDDPNGSIGITIAGSNGSGSVIDHYQVPPIQWLAGSWHRGLAPCSTTTRS